MNFDFTMRSIQRTVIDAGGEWIGIQPALPTDFAALPQLVFRHPHTKKIVIVPFNPISINEDELFKTVRVSIEQDSETTFPLYVSVKVSVLKKLARNFHELAAELEALLERKKS